MSPTERSERAVEGALARLRDDHGTFEVVDREWSVSPAGYDRDRRRFAAGTVGGAGAWVRDDGRVLLVRHEGGSAWSEPAGKQEPGERLEAKATRETREETGLAVRIEGVRLAQRVTETAPGRRSLVRLIVAFDATPVGGELEPREGEIAEARWFESVPADVLYPELREFPV